MPSVRANGITVEYDEHGAGDPVLLVMGLGGQLTGWPTGLVERLAGRGRRVIRFDNRDSGLSTEWATPPPTSAQIARSVILRRGLDAPYRLSDMAADAVGVLDALGVEAADVVGMSMGGMIAQTMAIEHPTRVRSLTSIMSTTGNRWVGQPTLRLVRQFARRPVPTRERAAEAAVDVLRAISGPTFDETEAWALAEASVERSFRPGGVGRQTAAITASPDRTPSLAEVTAPTLVVHGMLDPLVRPSGGIATARAIPNSRLLMFNDMAHDLPPTRWDEIVDGVIRIGSQRPVGSTV